MNYVMNDFETLENLQRSEFYQQTAQVILNQRKIFIEPAISDASDVLDVTKRFFFMMMLDGEANSGVFPG